MCVRVGVLVCGGEGGEEENLSRTNQEGKRTCNERPDAQMATTAEKGKRKRPITHITNTRCWEVERLCTRCMKFIVYTCVHLAFPLVFFFFLWFSSLPSLSSFFFFTPFSYQLDDFKSELAALRVEQVTGGSASKLAKM